MKDWLVIGAQVMLDGWTGPWAVEGFHKERVIISLRERDKTYYEIVCEDRLSPQTTWRDCTSECDVASGGSIKCGDKQLTRSTDWTEVPGWGCYRLRKVQYGGAVAFVVERKEQS